MTQYDYCCWCSGVSADVTPSSLRHSRSCVSVLVAHPLMLMLQILAAAVRLTLLAACHRGTSDVVLLGVPQCNSPSAIILCMQLLRTRNFLIALTFERAFRSRSFPSALINSLDASVSNWLQVRCHHHLSDEPFALLDPIGIQNPFVFSSERCFRLSRGVPHTDTPFKETAARRGERCTALEGPIRRVRYSNRPEWKFVPWCRKRSCLGGGVSIGR